jgi:hypothetical protein
MTLLAFGLWTIATLLLFATVPARTAAAVALVSGALFLPLAKYPIVGLPDCDKPSTIAFGLVAGAVLFDRARWVRLRPRWIDLPMIVWCAAPVASAWSNGLGLYDGISEATGLALTWGVPYAVGRCYFADLDALATLAVAIVVGAMVYVPLCLYEVVAGPRLHYILYGFYQSSPAEAVHFGGWRPMVFMQTGLMVGLWMAAGCVVASWCWSSGAVPRLARISTGAWAVLLGLTTVLVKSVNGWLLLVVGLSALAAVRLRVGGAVMAILIAAAPVYVGLRISHLWSGAEMEPAVAAVLGQERAQSIGYRLQQEQTLLEKALEKPLVGWGGWGRSRIYNQRGVDVSVTDALWIVALGPYGLLAVVACFAVFALAPAVLWWRHPVAGWGRPPVAPAASLGVLVCLFAIDCCLNAMINPVYLAAAGGLAGLPNRPAAAIPIPS